MADKQFQFILQAAEMLEEQRPGEIGSEEDTGQSSFDVVYIDLR